MSTAFRQSALLALALCTSSGLLAGPLLLVPFEFQQRATTYNLQSLAGVPISSVSNSPAGSNGRMPPASDPNESGTYNPSTINQFKSLVSFGAIAARTNWLALSTNALLRGSNAFSASVAVAMQLPRAYSNGTVAMVLRRAQVGAPYLVRKVDFAFGNLVEVPANNENGASLTVVKETYWQAEPYSTNHHADAGYYYSPHAQKVFAIQAGAMKVTWCRLTPFTAATFPASYVNLLGDQSFLTNGASIYLLYTVSYIVSGSPSKPPLKMYWTEREYRVTGLPVAVPRGRVGGINIAYNNEFPRTVVEEYRGPGYTSPTEGTTNAALSELRTLWYDQGQGYIYAYNMEGRAFVELLGDASPDGQTREPLGYEIVDVVKQPVPADLAVELGERLVPPAPESADDLYAEPVLTTDGLYVYRHTQAVSGRLNLYATRETTSPNDSLVHWLEAGVAGIKWPKVLARYAQVWPDTMAKYSHYIRPSAATEDEAKATAVQLSTDNVPFIAYQDPMDRPRAKLTEEFKFFTFLDAAVPAHRTLLRFTAGEYVAFERVFSWLDASLRTTNFVGSIATNLKEINNYANYPALYAAYTNRLAAAMVSYRAPYAAYTNYLRASSNYVSQYTAYRNYLDQLAAYNAYANWMVLNYAYTNINPEFVYANDFSGVSPPQGMGLFSGTAGCVGGVLKLTDWVSYQSGSYVVNLPSGIFAAIGSGSPPLYSFTATFKLNLNNNYFLPVADGFSFNFGQYVPDSPAEGHPNDLSVCFDLDPNSSEDEAPGISIKYNNGTTKAAVGMNLYGYTRQMLSANYPAYPTGVLPVPTDPATGMPMDLMTENNYVPVKIVMRNGGFMDVFFRNVQVLANVATGFIPGPGFFNFSASTSWRACSQSIDDLMISVTADPGPAPPYASLPAVVASPGAPPTVVLEPILPDVGPVPSPDIWTSDITTPRVVLQTVCVGDRIAAPAGELGQTSYLAGHINADLGTLYHPGAYVDPLVSGFTAAAKGAIIPVNAVPGTNQLEVWWFRTNSLAAGPNAGNNRLGFASIYWPAVLGRYTIAWPANPREIVLASKLGSGTLDTLEALGSIYRQNDPSLPGYNPNEEHALMSGGTAFATRDDLNLTNATNYSSHPFVLVQYTASDGRPAVSAFKVLREKPAAGYVFDYIIPAGQILQAPMPLPLLAKPVLGTGDYAVNYNTEPPQTGGDLPGGWNSSYATNALYSHYQRFTWRDRHNDFWVYRGPHAGLPVLQAGTYTPATKTFTALTNATAVAGTAFSCSVHASRQDEFLALTVSALPDWLSISGLTLRGTPDTNDVGTNVLQLVVRDLYDYSSVTNSLRLAVVRSGSVAAQGLLAMASTNRQSGSIVVFSNRPPCLAVSPNSSNSFTMRFYYKTEASFDWPGLDTPPAVGSIVPYLRPINPATNAFIGDAAVRDTDSLEIVYRPVWPERDPADASKAVPTLAFGGTVANSKFNLPGVRDMLTAEILYQQSLAANLAVADPSAILHDATREKYSDLTAQQLAALPGGVLADYYQSRYYFPNLPPHIATRLYFDPNRGAKGALVLQGEFVAETLGESYLMLNVLRGTDLALAKGLCPVGDSDKSKWDALVDGLATDLETFYEDPNVPGSYIPNDTLTKSVGVGVLAEVKSANTAVDSYAVSAVGPGSGYVTLVEASGTAFTQVGDPIAMHIFKVGGPDLYAGEVKVIAAANPLSEQVTFQHTADLAGRFDEFEYEWKIAAPVDGLPPVSDDTMSAYLSLATGTDQPRRTLGGAGIQALADNYVVMRYRPKAAAHPLYNQWSAWTSPKLAEGWIKRVLAGINPFNQRTTDLFNNQVNTDVSMLTQAGQRWEGDVALNADSINNYGLIEIYETVLRRGRMLSIESGYNYGPANDALLLAAGYLNDLYVMIGGEAWADAANPTIGIGTADKTYGDIATSLFAFKGQVGSLLEEELALLRGRDDFLLPGVQVSPVYNRLVWNYTRGIDSGEVIYALNYNIQEDPNKTPDGIINAADAAILFPQGHGDAYGHYLTALKGYYSMLMNSCFDWVPRIEAVNVLGQPVSVDYQDERKFAAAGAAVARAGRQIFDLTWRRDYAQVHEVGWGHLGASRVNTQRQYVAAGAVTNYVTRYWGTDQWACRAGQGAFLNWAVGNGILPAEDPNPLHEGIQKIDRTTVTELEELATTLEGLQTALDNAEAGLSPLGIPEGGLAFDINPAVVVGTDNGTHFEQIYTRTKTALNNAVVSFDDAKNVTQLMRSEQDSLAGWQSQVASQEHAYNNSLIELYGTPYPDDIGAGKTWKQGYVGPDLVHYMYADLPEVDWFGNAQEPATFKVDIQELPESWLTRNYTDLDFVTLHTDGGYTLKQHYIEYTLGSHGFYGKPAVWTGVRSSPGKVQQAISEMIAAHTRLGKVLEETQRAKQDFDKAIRLFRADVQTHDELRSYKQDLLIAEQTLASVEHAFKLVDVVTEHTKNEITLGFTEAKDALPQSFIAGLAAGGDLTAPARAAMEAVGITVTAVMDWTKILSYIGVSALGFATDTANRWTTFNQMAPLEWQQELRGAVADLGNTMNDLNAQLVVINQQLRAYDDSQRKYRALLAEGDRLQAEREIFRQRSAAMIQGYRTRDAAFRLFRNEKLERYKTLFDLAARYSLLAANAYDYETGLLNTSVGRAFVARIIQARALGVVRNGEPQYAGSDTGDPGLSSVLAEMKADWDVLRGRLGFNNPDAYGTTVSLRTENLRILPTSDGDSNWKDVLQAARQKNILEDSDVRRYCMRIDDGSGLPVPGIVLTFSTTIADGYNLFGKPLAAGDHNFSASSFATKIFGVGVDFEGYRGMDDPSANSSSGGTSPSDPTVTSLDALALAATPYVYLIPVGVDSMRSPPLGDASTIRTWSVDDLAIPMPFNIGASDLNTKQLWTSSDSLTEALFAIRKHQAFRPVSTTSVFSPSLYGDTGTLRRSQFTNNRLVGRSVWNSQWKLIIPGKNLLNNPNEGLDRFIQTVTDMKLHFVTYSYSGN
jgi:hypothetical protein